MEIKEMIEYLKGYQGKPLRIMEVCGTHTSSIVKNGIRNLISEKIKLISGPGCPVCVTPTSYIDQCIAYAKKENHVLCSFGDMMKVPGENSSLSQIKGEGGKVQLMYSPFEVLAQAEKDQGNTYVIAAVGFETTVPVYGLAIEAIWKKQLKNVKLLTSLKTIMPALTWICQEQEDIDGFLCPGHVSVIMGSSMYRELAQIYGKPCVVAGFEAEHVLAGIYRIVRQLENGQHQVENLYKNAVKEDGNLKAKQAMDEYFELGKANWRGLGIIENSGIYVKKKYSEIDGGSFGLDKDKTLPKECRCADVIVGRINPNQCSMFGSLCHPQNPYGPCMVSSEGACGVWYGGM